MPDETDEKQLTEMTTEEALKFLFPPEAVEVLNTAANVDKKQVAATNGDCDDDS